MVTPLLKTKLNIPSLRPAHVTRSRLLENLNKDIQGDEGFTRKLTLVSAPAGYGKTTLVVEWFHSQETQVAWFSLDESDNDPLRFLTYLINALGQVHEGIGSAALGMLQSPQLPPPETLLTPLLNEIVSMQSPFFLVIDDYHLIQTPIIHQHLNFLIEHLPSQMHIVIVTREDPPLPLPRLRAQGKMLEIRQEDIRFTIEETTEFIGNIISEKLSSENITAVERRTEGWVTGIQLLVLSLQKHPDAQEFIQTFTGSERFVLDYLFEEVFHQQAEEIQDFLITTSILENLSAGLCEAVTGRGDSDEILRSLDHANLFILPLDQSQNWYRYHRLFRDLLRHRLQMQQEVSQSELHQKASQWYQDQDYMENAIHHSLAGSNWERAAALIYQASDTLLKGGAIATMIGWFKRLPVEIIRSKPEYCLTYVWPLLLSGQVDSADPFLEAAEELAGDNPQLLGEIASAQAFQAQTRGDEQRLIERSELALSLLPEADLSTRSILALNLGIAYWHNGDMVETERALNEALPAARQTENKYAEISTLLFLGRTYAVRGRLQQAMSFFNGIVEAKVQVPIVVLAHLDLSALYYEWNDPKKSDHHLEQGIELIGRSDIHEFKIAALMQKARLQLARGNHQGALEALKECDRIEADHEIPIRTRARKAACAVEVHLAMDNLEIAAHWAEQVIVESDAHPFYRFLYLTPVRLLMAQNKKAEALDLLDKAYKAANQAEWIYGVIALRILQSLAAPNRDATIKYITDALTLAQPERFIRIFVDGGPTLKPLLVEAAHQGVFPEYVGEILKAFEKEIGLQKAALPPGIEPLSERELEVLRLLAAGLTNRQIAEQIVVSISTVKSHVHHICNKLDASNRTQAVARARQLDLL
jgi:LuxR family maltose regulon positive regulatory protein